MLPLGLTVPMECRNGKHEYTLPPLLLNVFPAEFPRVNHSTTLSLQTPLDNGEPIGFMHIHRYANSTFIGSNSVPNAPAYTVRVTMLTAFVPPFLSTLQMRSTHMMLNTPLS
jgi:hypothetical protein